MIFILCSVGPGSPGWHRTGSRLCFSLFLCHNHHDLQGGWNCLHDLVPFLGFWSPRVWETRMWWQDRSSKTVSLKNGTSTGVCEQESVKGQQEEEPRALTSKSLWGLDTEWDNVFLSGGNEAPVSPGSCVTQDHRRSNAEGSSGLTLGIFCQKTWWAYHVYALAAAHVWLAITLLSPVLLSNCPMS